MTSRFEILVRKIFKYLLPDEEVIYNHRPDWIKNITGNNLELDLYFPKLNFAIEVNGFVHSVLLSQKRRDKIKLQSCLKHKVYLLSISNILDFNKESVRKIVLKHTRTDLHNLSDELVQEIILYRPNKKVNLQHQIIFRQKKEMMIERSKIAQENEYTAKPFKPNLEERHYKMKTLKGGKKVYILRNPHRYLPKIK